MGYFNLTRSQLDTFDKIDLMRQFKGTFSIRLNEFSIFELMKTTYSVCPLIFKDALIERFYITLNMQVNLITKHILKFSSLKIEDSSKFDLNANIIMADVLFYRITVDSFLDRNIFKRSARLNLMGTFLPFENDELSKSFSYLTDFSIRPTNMREFIHSSNNKWFAYLNEEVLADQDLWCSMYGGNVSSYLELTKQKYFLINLPEISDSYTYPEESAFSFKNGEMFSSKKSSGC